MYKWEYVKGQRAPKAVLTTDKTDGASPLTVNFSSAGSLDEDPGELRGVTEALALSNERLSQIIREVFDLRPGAIARHFRLWTLPRERGGHFYRDLAVGGQVGRTDLDLPWEALDRIDALRDAAGVVAIGGEP